MPKPVQVKALANYRVWLRYDDGAEGTVDLSDLAGRGVFKAWDDAAHRKVSGRSVSGSEIRSHRCLRSVASMAS